MAKRVDIQRRVGIKGRIVDALTDFFIPDMTIRGSANLQTVRDLSSTNTPIFFMPNHSSNADAPAIFNVLKRNGFNDIAGKLVFLLGKRLKKNPLTNPLVDSYSIIPVWPPSLTPKSHKEERERIEANRRSLISTREALKQGLHIVIFPEGTRSRTEGLIAGHPAIMDYVPLDAVIVPVGITGTREVLKPETVIPIRSPVTVNFGIPIDVSKITDKSLKSQERRQQAMDQVMKALAASLPEQQRGVYP